MHWLAFAVFVLATISGCATAQTTVSDSTASPIPTSTPLQEREPGIAAEDAFDALTGFIAENQDDRFYQQLANWASYDVGTWDTTLRAWIFEGGLPDDIDDPGFQGLKVVFIVYEKGLHVELMTAYA